MNNRLKALAALMISLVVLHPIPSAGQSESRLSDYETVVLELCRGIVELFEARSDAIWPGYDLSRQPFLVYLPDRWALLFNPPEPVSEFVSPPAGWPPFRGKVLYHPGKYGDLAGQLVFDFSVGPLKTIAVGLPPERPKGLKNVEPSFFGFIIHEAFHQYQSGNFGEIPWEREERYPILNSENSALAFLEMELLRDAQKASAAWQKEKRDDLLQQFVAVRDYRWSRAPEFVSRYEQGQEIREGTAQYVETRSLIVAKNVLPKLPSSRTLPRLLGALRAISFPGHLWQAFKLRMRDRYVPPEDMLRNRIYPVGAALGLMLDEVGIEWKAKAQAAGEGFRFDQLLAEHFKLASEDMAGLFETACRSRDCPGLRAAAEKAGLEYRQGFEAELRRFEARPGKRVELVFNYRSLSRSGSSSAKKWVVDDGSRSLCFLFSVYTLRNDDLRLDLHETGVLEWNDWDKKKKSVSFFIPEIQTLGLDGRPVTLQVGERTSFGRLELEAANASLTVLKRGTVERTAAGLKIELASNPPSV
jgi:hypothetical protein